jgi:hypothetical protein
VICRPDTPTPWVDYLGGRGYGGITSNTAGGFSLDRDPKKRHTGNAGSLVVHARPVPGSVVPLPSAGTAPVRVESILR